MIATLRNRSFTLLWIGGFISQTGNWMLFIALPIAVFEHTGSTLATGTMFMARFIPSLLFGSPAGVAIDRWNRKWTVVVTNALLALAIAPLLVVRSGGWLWLVYLAACVEATLSQLLGAEGALLPRLVETEYLITANSLNAVSFNTARLLGPALAGIVMGTLSLAGVVELDVGSYLAAAFLAACVIVPRLEENADVSAGLCARGGVTGLSRVWREWLAGLKLVRGHSLLMGIFAVWALAAAAEGIFEVLVVPFVKEILHGGALQFGWLMSAQAIGGIAGGLLTGWAGRHIQPAYLIAISMVSVGIADLLIWNIPVVTFEVTVIAIMGGQAIGFTLGTTTLMQQTVADGFRGRVGGALGTTWAAFILAGMGGASVLGGTVGTVLMLNLSGVLALATGTMALVVVRERDESHQGKSA